MARLESGESAPACYSECVSVCLRVALALAASTCFAAAPSLLDVMSQELQRNFEGLRAKADPPPYFISYSVVDNEADVFSGILGALQIRRTSHSRTLDVSVRVGSPKLDNYHATRGERPQFSSGSLLPLDDSVNAIRRRLWAETDRTYRAAAQRLINLRTSTQLNVADEDKSDDFSKEEPSVYTAEPRRSSPDTKADWSERVRRYSALFKKYPKILNSSVTVQVIDQSKYTVNTEGTRLQHGRGFARITINAQAKASDGMNLSASDSFEAELPAGLAGDAVVTAATEKVARDLTAMLDAPVVDPYVGPAILSGRAAGVFFHEIFGHRIEGHRQKDETEDQTFTKRVGQPILPEFLSVIFDPTRKQIGGVDLNGTYLFDDEGVKGRPVAVVEKGILRTFLLSRSPIAGFSQSNGHGRKQAGLEAVSRQSNLIVDSSRKVSDRRLREMLVEEMKRQGKPFGYYFEHVTGGYTTTGRGGFQSFKVIPLVVYRVYADGKPDELIRGADIVGTPLSSFAKILATSDQMQVFNGYCGAESGSVPVSAVSPSILISELEIQKKEKGNDQPPLLPPPPAVERAAR